MAKDLPDEHQQEFLDCVRRGDVRVITLTGQAGAGKTWTLAQLAEMTGNGHLYIRDEEGKIPRSWAEMAQNIAEQAPDARLLVYASPTHQAMNVLIGELEHEGVRKAIVRTTAAVLKKTPNMNKFPSKDVLDLDFVRGDPEPFPAGTIVVTDETSMVNDEDVEILLRLNEHGLTIFSGDHRQLPPTEGKPCWPRLNELIAKGKGRAFDLLGNHRAKEANLAAFINHVRQYSRLPEGKFANVRLYDDRDVFLSTYIEMMDREGPEHVLLLAYQNKTVNSAGAQIRAHLEYRVGRAEVGELLRVNVPGEFLDWHEVNAMLRREYLAIHGGRSIPDNVWKEMFQETGRIVRESLLQIGDALEVVYADDPQPFSVPWLDFYPMPRQSVRVRILTGEFQGQEHNLGLAELNNTQDIRAVLEGTKEIINNITDKNQIGPREQAMLDWAGAPKEGKTLFGWLLGKCFYGTKKEFCLTQNASSLTIHKAQGSGCDHVFVDWVDLFGVCTDALRYTSVSRARQTLHIYVGGGL